MHSKWNVCTTLMPFCTWSHSHMPVTPCRWGVCIKGQLTKAEWEIDGLHWGLGVLAVSIIGSLHCPFLPCVIDLYMYVFDLLLHVCGCVHVCKICFINCP